MKKTLLSTILSLLGLGIFFTTNAQNVNIPDANFKSFLVSNPEINTNSDSEIQVSEANSFSGKINCNNRNITDLTGIEEFVNLKRLECYYNNISNIDLSSNTNLRYIDCSYSYVNNLIPPEGTNLTALICNNNLISSLNVSTNTNLDSLLSQHNKLTNIDISTNTNLSFFSCEYNEINNLDVTNNVNLEYFYCNYNKLTSLDISKNILLIGFGCFSNKLTNLDLSNNPELVTVNTNFNNLSSLDVSNNLKLKYLRCKENNIGVLDLTLNTDLVELSCQSNNLTCLNVKNGKNTKFGTILGYFNATNNPNLTCIEVDDVMWSNANMTNIDTTSSFSTSCPDCTSGISEFENNNNFKIYPNPTTGKFIVESTNIERIEIFDINGKLILKTTQKEIDLSTYEKGLYLVKLITLNNTITKQIIVE